MFAWIRRVISGAGNQDAAAPGAGARSAPTTVGASGGRRRDDAAALSAAVTAISHEIRTPLTTILGVLRVLSGSTIEPHHARLVETAERAGRRLQAWVDNMADYVAPEAEAEGGAAERRPSVLADAIYDAVESSAIDGTPASLAVEVDPAVAQTRVGDPRRLRQVLFTMVDSVLTSVDQGTFRLVARVRDGDQLVVTVRDPGAAWREERRALALQLLGAEEPPDVATLRDGGFALGLAAAQRAARWMGGDLTARPEGRGGLTLELSVIAPAAPLSDPNATASLKILVAEDNAVNRKLIQVMLQGLGHAPVIVAGGEEAVRAVDTQDFDLVFMDLHMPDMDGFAAAEAIRARTDHRADVPIVALTADVGQDVRDRALAGPMAAFVTKPVELDELSSVIAQVTSAA